MIEQEINIAISEVCGIHGPWLEKVTACGCDGQWDWFNAAGKRLPDYCHDLNAMREAVLSMDEDNRAMWFNNLCDIVNRDRDLGLDAMSLFALINATARQRAKAFLITIGKWKE